MNTQEAIKAIRDNWPPEQYTMLREALELAIKALEKREQLQKSIRQRIADQRRWGNPVNLEIAKELQAILDD